MARRLEGKTAIITGAGAGIGRATAKLFVQEGARVVIAERNETAGRAAEAELSALGGEALFVPTDVTDEGSVATMVKAALGLNGRIDILYNNAGGSSTEDGRTPEVPEEVFWRSLKLDLHGTWLCTKYVLPIMKEQGKGAIVNSGSHFGVMGWPGRDAYSAAKGGVISLSRANAVSYARYGIRVNVIMPGNTRTERAKSQLVVTPDFASLPERHPLGLCEPEDIAYGVLYLASDEARKVTGHILAVDGGLTVG